MPLAAYATAGQVQLFRDLGAGVDLTRDAQLTSLLLDSCTRQINAYLGISYQAAAAYTFNAPIITTKTYSPYSPWGPDFGGCNTQTQTVPFPYVATNVASITVSAVSIPFNPMVLDMSGIAQSITLASAVTGTFATVVADIGLPGGVPADIQHACALLVAEVISRDVSGFSRTFNNETGLSSSGAFLPSGVKDLLQPYINPTIA